MEKNDLILISFTFALIVLIFAMIIRTPAYTGKVVEVNNLDDAINQLDELKEEYNLKANTFPGFIARIFGNEVMHIEITRTNGSVEDIDVKTVNGKVIDVNNVTDPCTLNINTNEDTFEQILNSEDQIKAFKRALDTKKIKYESRTFKTRVKMGAVRTALLVRSFF
jgi:hypothetical protein